MSYVDRAHKLNLITPPPYVYKNLQYEVIMGSFAYGVSSETSDLDIYGFCIPYKSIVFPHTTGRYIFGYDATVPENFSQWQEHHIIDQYKRKEYDFNIFNIAKYMRLCADGNPNMIDSLFVPFRCITHSSPIGNLVRECRFDFLSKQCWVKFKGYAYSQLHKIDIKKPTGKRKKDVEKYGYDLKYAYHLVRLLNEIEQILLEGNLDIERNREQLKSIRDGRWNLYEIKEYFQMKERSLEELHLKSELPDKPQYDKIRNLLYKCLSMHFQEDIKPKVNINNDLLEDLRKIIYKYDQ